MGHICRVFTDFRFPDEPGLSPDPAAQEQQFLRMTMGATLIAVRLVRARAIVRKQRVACRA